MCISSLLTLYIYVYVVCLILFSSSLYKVRKELCHSFVSSIGFQCFRNRQNLPMVFHQRNTQTRVLMWKNLSWGGLVIRPQCFRNNQHGILTCNKQARFTCRRICHKVAWVMPLNVKNFRWTNIGSFWEKKYLFIYFGQNMQMSFLVN